MAKRTNELNSTWNVTEEIESVVIHFKLKYNCKFRDFLHVVVTLTSNFYRLVTKNFKNDNRPFFLAVSEIFQSVLEVYRIYHVCI